MLSRIVSRTFVFFAAIFLTILFAACERVYVDGTDSEILTIDLAERVPLKMVKVSAAGAGFQMGEGVNSKAMRHTVNFKKDYYIGQYEVTQAQWNALMEANPSCFKGDDLPVEKVLWDEVMEFCRKLNESGKAPAGWKFTLPTEAQWEFAAKGGTKSKGYKYSGSDELEDVAWYNDNSGDVSLKGRQKEPDYSILRQNNNNRTHPVGQKKPNELGLYDMNGNVKEMCLDAIDFNSGAAITEAEASANKDTVMCAMRGEGFIGSAEMGFNTARSLTFRNLVADRSSVFGFRLALVQTDPALLQNEAD